VINLRLFIIAALTLYAGSVWAAVAFDAVSASVSSVPGTSTTQTHIVGSDATIVLICVSSRDTGSAIQPVTSVTVGGSAATLLNRVQNSANALSAELWYRLSPPAGLQTINVTNNAANDRTVTTAITLKGSDSAAPFGASIATSDPGSDNANVDINGIASAVGEMGILCGAARTNLTTASPDATSVTSIEEIEMVHGDATSNIGFIYSEDGASPTIDMRVDLTPAARWAAVAVSVKNLTVAPSTNRHRTGVILP
jgi:hypothetical protein